MNRIRSRVKIGLKPSPATLAKVESDSQLVEQVCRLGYSEVLVPVTNVRYRESCKAYFHSFGRGALSVPAPSACEVELLEGDHIQRVIGLLSSWVELDSSEPLITDFSYQVIQNEVSYASHIGVKTVLLAPPKNVNNLAVFASNLNRLLETFPEMHFSLSLPICEEIRHDEAGLPIPVLDNLSTWDLWNSIRTQCNYPANLSVSLGSPNHNIPQYVVNRWLLEPIRLYLVSTSRFVLNFKNYPVLNKFNQIIIWKIVQKKALDPPTLFLHGVDRESDITSHLRDITLQNDVGQDSNHNPPASKANVSLNDKTVSFGNLAYLDYLRHLVNTSSANPQLPVVQQFTLDSLKSANVDLSSAKLLQEPLQPLQNNLDTATYKTFERDSTKYECYEKAIVASLADLLNTQKFHNNLTEKLAILVVGPGRGPLIDRVFSAAKFLSMQQDSFEVVAVEKNPNVMVHLNRCNSTKWDGRVNLVNEDIRSYGTETRFNLVISELLGSFGCNELSPECLANTSRLEDTGNCIYIPQSVSSFIAPATSPSIHAKLDRLDSKRAWNVPYVPLVDTFDVLSSRFEKLWTFEYPSLTNSAHETSFRRSGEAVFKCHHKGTLHGLLGHFSAELYGGIRISNAPTGPTPHSLMSWLPVFFPLSQPMYLPDDQELSVLVKREVSGSRMWYEWCVESFMYLVLPTEKSRSRDSLSFRQHRATKSLTTPGLKASLFGNEQFFETAEDEGELSDEEVQMRVRTGISKTHNANGRFYSAFF